MRILHIITGLSAGGAERVLFNLLSGGLSDGDNHVVLSLRGEGVYGRFIRSLGVPVHTLDIRTGMPIAVALPRLWCAVRVFKPDIIQGWMYHGNVVASLARRLSPGRPALAWNMRHSLYGLSHEKPLTRQVVRINRLLSSNVDSVVYCSRLSQRQHETFGLASGRAIVIPNGFDLGRLRPARDQGKNVRRMLGISMSAQVVGHVARFHPMKDHALFLRSAVRVAKARADTCFLLVGSNVRPDNAVLKDLIPSGLEHRFIFLGERQDVASLMQTMDMFCLSSAWGEAFPNVLGEAMAIEVPCVATDVGDCAHIVSDTGTVVPPSDEDALFHALMAMLGLSSESRQALGRAARARIEANFALNAVVAQYADLYQRLS